jgi:hypothetical protein
MVDGDLSVTVQFQYARCVVAIQYTGRRIKIKTQAVRFLGTHEHQSVAGRRRIVERAIRGCRASLVRALGHLDTVVFAVVRAAVGGHVQRGLKLGGSGRAEVMRPGKFACYQQATG